MEERSRWPLIALVALAALLPAVLGGNALRGLGTGQEAAERAERGLRLATDLQRAAARRGAALTGLLLFREPTARTGARGELERSYQELSSTRHAYGELEPGAAAAALLDRHDALLERLDPLFEGVAEEADAATAAGRLEREGRPLLAEQEQLLAALRSRAREEAAAAQAALRDGIREAGLTLLTSGGLALLLAGGGALRLTRTSGRPAASSVRAS